MQAHILKINTMFVQSIVIFSYRFFDYWAKWKGEEKGFLHGSEFR